MTGMRPRAWTALKVLPLLLLMGNKPACDNRPVTMSCDTVSVQLDLGECVDLQNPCGDHTWVRLDAFRLCDNLDGLFVQTLVEPRARQICADASVGTLMDVPFGFYYARPNEAGIGTLRVTVGSPPLTVTATATPSSVPPGGASQLEAVVSGGSPPYAFSWSPSTGLSATDIPNPIASPPATTQYTVVVSDDNGLLAGATVVVEVGLGVTAAASPSTIAPGQSSSLSVQVTGGAPPYTFSWSPAATLDDPAAPNPVATPTQTTTYDVVVTDLAGAQGSASVTVTVSAALAACMTLLPISPIAVQADGTCSTGSIVLYRWWSDFQGAGQPPRAETTTPFSPVFTYEIPGDHTVRLEVVDTTGATSATTATFTSG